jgi:hypothetical protein
MTNIAITESSRGTTIATNGVLTQLLYSRGPWPGTRSGNFTLIDDSGPGVPRTIYNIELCSSPWAIPRMPENIFNNELFSGASISYGNLTVASCPPGCIMEVTVSP